MMTNRHEEKKKKKEEERRRQERFFFLEYGKKQEYSTNPHMGCSTSDAMVYETDTPLFVLL